MLKTKIQKDEFIKNNLGLVHSLANKFRGRGIDYDDLYSAGCIGLLKAFDGFDESRGLMFSTYAVPVILGEIKRLFRDGGAIKVSRGLKELSLKVNRERERFAKSNCREPTLTELSEILQESIDNIIEAINIAIPPISLTIDDEDDSNKNIDISDSYSEENICEMISIKHIVEKLDINDRNLISLRYFKNKTQTQTAKILGMTQVQVSRREKKILSILKENLL